jgi:hypothetical protein
MTKAVSHPALIKAWLTLRSKEEVFGAARIAAHEQGQKR